MEKLSVCYLILSCAVSGCAGSQAVYEKAPGPGQDDLVINSATAGGEVFVLPKSKVMVTPKQNKVSGTEPVPKSPPPKETHSSAIDGNDLEYTATVVPYESDHRYAVRPVSGFWSKTQLQITKIPNTDMTQQVGVTFTDLTKSRIEQIGGIVTSIVGAIGFLADETKATCAKHVALKDFVVPIDDPITQPVAVPGNPCWSYSMTYSSQDAAVGAISIEKFESLFGDKVGFFPAPACRDINIILSEPAVSPNDRKSIVIAARVIDPRNVKLVPLPIKGSIKMHPICGADVSDDGGTDRFAQFQDDLSAVMTQAKAIEDKVKK